MPSEVIALQEKSPSVGLLAKHQLLRTAIHDRDLTGADRAVLDILIEKWTADRGAFPSDAYIAELTSYSDRRVRVSLQNLRRFGYIIKLAGRSRIFCPNWGRARPLERTAASGERTCGSGKAGRAGPEKRTCGSVDPTQHPAQLDSTQQEVRYAHHACESIKGLEAPKDEEKESRQPASQTGEEEESVSQSVQLSLLPSANSNNKENRQEAETQTKPKATKKPSTMTAEEFVELFDEFWDLYPRRVGKGAARTAFMRALRKTDSDTILDGVDELIENSSGKDPQFIPHPATWLNQERWEDEDVKPKKKRAPWDNNHQL